MLRQILIVEDNALNRELLCEILRSQYEVLQAENGREALEILERHADETALILLDVMMPVMDGYAFLDAIKADERFMQIPVIVMTQENSEADEINALAHGATDFVPKPYRPRVILHRIASIIKLRESAAMVNQFKYDPLTGLYSREYFYRKVRRRLQESPEQDYSILCSNIENFKLYNDTFGVQEGDRLLRNLALRARSELGRDAICGRFAADRFLFMIPRDSALISRLSLAHQQNASIPGISNVKWGVYEIRDRAVSVEQMCDRAFLAVDSIKGQYHQVLAVYDDALRSRLLREQAITDAMESALAQGQFTVFLQPKFNLNDDSLAGAEALVRWTHPELGFLSPGEFIPIFERNGFITRLDRYVWEETCRLLQVWQSRGLATLPISVNVSRADLYQPGLPDMLTELVRRYGLSPDLLHLEITESAYTENPGQIIATVRELRGRGFIIEMDDFGSGYSSLNMLNQMRIDILKLDMKFIQSETAKPTDKGILHFIVDLAKGMSLGVVAEGVETREQLNRLREIGCDYVQGYFFSRPIPVAEYERSFLCKPGVGPHALSIAQDDAPLLLIADEDEARRAEAAQWFSGLYRVQQAGNAAEAMALLREHAPGISALLLSMTLPEHGARRIAQHLCSDTNAWRIPVLATGPAEPQAEELSIDIGADDFAAWPCTARLLRRRLERVLGQDAHQRREQELQDEACLDYLTGLLNRRGLHMAISALRQEDLPLTACLFDLDGLHRINDQLGRAAGDDALTAFAKLLRTSTRDHDVLARCGGDEFAVLLRRMGDPDIARRKAQSICDAFARSMEERGISCSAGISICSVDERPTEVLIRHADEALRQARKADAGKAGCIGIYEG